MVARGLSLRFAALASLAWGAALVGGCGAEGREAPFVPAPDADTGCPSTEEALADTNAALEDGLFDPIRPVVEDVLVEQGGMSILVRAAALVLPEAGMSELLGALGGLPQGEGAARLVPHLVAVLDYFQGTSEYIPGEHWGPVDSAHAIMATCDAVTTLSTVRRLLDLEAVAADGTATTWLKATFDALHEVARDPTFTALLERIELDEQGGEGDIRVGRDAFRLLARLVVGNVASPNYDAAYTRALIEDVLLVQLAEGDDETRARVRRLLDLLDVIVDPEADIFPGVQEVMGCVNRHDPDGEIAGMLYDYLSIEELSFTDFLDDLGALGSSSAGFALHGVVQRSAAALESDPRLAQDATSTLARMISPAHSRVVVPFVSSLRGRGVAAELGDLLHLAVERCGGDDA